MIGGTRDVGGGFHSVRNADLLAGAGMDLVIVSGPMGGTRDGFTRGMDLPLRAAIRARLAREVTKVRRTGTAVLTLQPTREVRAAMGDNPMDPSRGAAVARSAYESTLARLKDENVRERIAALA